MGKIRKSCLAIFCILIVTSAVISSGWKCNQAYGKDKETYLTSRSTPTQGLMRIISSHTAKMLDAIMIGDFTAVIKESHEIIGASEVGMQMFFPEKGKVGEWFVNAGNDPNDAAAVEAMKEEFQKYLQLVIDASRKVAETSEKRIS